MQAMVHGFAMAHHHRNHWGVYSPGDQTNPPCIKTTAPTFAASRSFHPGGVNSLLGDGSVRFFKNSVSLPVWRALSTLAGSEVVSSDAY
jgi:hypothetical protein